MTNVPPFANQPIPTPPVPPTTTDGSDQNSVESLAETASKRSKKPIEPLTPDQWTQLLELKKQRLTNVEIAKQMGFDDNGRTVNGNIQNLKRKSREAIKDQYEKVEKNPYGKSVGPKAIALEAKFKEMFPRAGGTGGGKKKTDEALEDIMAGILGAL